jgi:hypothetical protein
MVHAACVRELFLWRAGSELSAVPRIVHHSLSEENRQLEAVRIPTIRHAHAHAHVQTASASGGRLQLCT